MECWKVGEWFPILYTVRGDLSEKVTFEQRPEESDVMSHVARPDFMGVCPVRAHRAPCPGGSHAWGSVLCTCHLKILNN